jgi:hypothetical protein
MAFRQIAFAGGLTVLLCTCASCDTADLDQNGDGVVTKQEFLSAALDRLCGDDTDEPSEEPADEETTEDNQQ